MKRLVTALLFVAACGGAQASPPCDCPCATATHGGQESVARDGAPEIAAADGTAAPPGANPLEAEYVNTAPLRTLRGQASYYHDSLAGNHTANGEVYEPAAFTAANRNLPFGTIVRIVRIDNGRSVVVRVNDRGPFGSRRRIFDLSRAAAEQVDMIAAGVVDVRAEILMIPE